MKHEPSQPAGSQATDEPIAIIGMACRLPGAPNKAAFWRLLCEGRDAIGPVPADRWTTVGTGRYGDASPVRAGLLEQIDRFDPLFFGISPREAASMDPQQRLMLELSWEALEDAGIIPTALAGTATGVFFGAVWSDYSLLLNARGAAAIDQYTVTGSQHGLIANRVSYTLDLRGPSLTVDTATSSSLVSTYLACQSLRTGQSALALAGGVNLLIAPESTIGMERLGALSPDGRCFAFDARANGYVRGEGGGVLVLKRLSSALADDDTIYCVLRGCAVGNDGARDGLAAPAAAAQAELLRAAYRQAGVAPEDVQYVEAHGTGTPLGDAAEASALGAVFAGGRSAATPLRIGSAKTNVGHLEAAAAVVGLIKVALCIKHRQLPPSLNFEVANPGIPFAALRLQVQTALSRWPAGATPLTAGVSAFGLGGTNGHAVLQEWRTAPAELLRAAPHPEPGAAAAPLPLLLSARSDAALRDHARQLADHLDVYPELSLRDVAWTLGLHRAHLRHRAAVLAADAAHARALLLELAAPDSAGTWQRGTVDSKAAVVFIFPGQGSQWPGVGRQLYLSVPSFARAMDEVAAALAPHTGWSLTEVLQAPDEQQQTLFERTEVVQPVLFALAVALAATWESLGVLPAAVVGHSQGEIAAAYVCGALRLPDAARIVAARSRLLRQLAGSGAMATLGLSAQQVEQRLQHHGGRVSVAVINSSESTGIAGEPAAVAAVLRELREQGVFCREIAVDYASHCVQVEPVLEPLRRALLGLRPARTRLPMISTVTGMEVAGTELAADYWVANLRQPVRLDLALDLLKRRGSHVYLELSGHPQLLTAVQEETAGVGRTVATLRRGDGGVARLGRAAAELHVQGGAVKWKELLGSGKRVELPTYPFQRQRYWVDAAPAAAPVAAAATLPPRVDATADGPSPPSLRQQLLQHGDGERARILTSLIRREVVAVLQLPEPAVLRDAQPLKELGLDSLLAGELRLRLGRLVESALPTTLLFNFPTVQELTVCLLQQLLPADLAHEDRAAKDRPDPQSCIAIVAMACRAPGGVRSPQMLWELLEQARDAIGAFPRDRGWDVDALYSPDPEAPGKSYCRSGGFLEELDRLDAELFGIAPREAARLDPQQRLLLETSWEALERAGIVPLSLAGSQTGVYMGLFGSGYAACLQQGLEQLDGYVATGSMSSTASGRIAYTLGLRGPAISIDTACSASLVSIHLAAQALRSGECDLALAGGVTVMMTPAPFVEFSRLRGLAPDGRCKAFSQRADGTGWSEGCGVVVLERLADAQRNGHPVLALIRGTAINQDGRSQGLTAPSGPAQQQVIAQALRDAGLTPQEIDAVEAHGTGTRLGDPIEAQALQDTYGVAHGGEGPLWLGSLKSNIGHTQAAAGVLGVIKVVLALQAERLPRTLHAEEPSRDIDWSRGRMRLLQQAQPWPRGARKRRAAVSSFGVSGTNAHLIVEEAPLVQQVACPAVAEGMAAAGVVPLLVSGQSPAAVGAQALALAERLTAAAAPSLGDIAWTLALHRSALSHRSVVMAADAPQAVVALRELAAGRSSAACVQGVARGSAGVVFVVPGQGSQWPGMGRALYQTDATFARAIDEVAAEVAAALSPSVDWSLTAALLADDDEQRRLFDRVEVVQPSLFALAVALARTLEGMGVLPSAVVGHSQGEIAAAYICGALSLPEAARIVALRSRLLAQHSGGGAMATIGLAAAQLAPRLVADGGRLCVAVVNSKSSTGVAGDPGALAQLLRTLRQEGVFCREIEVDYAAHSEQVGSLLEPLRRSLSGLRPRRARLPMISTVTGAEIEGTELNAHYWADNLRRPVQLQRALAVLKQRGSQVYVELSGHPQLLAAVQEETDGDPAVATLRRGEGGRQRVLRAAAELHVRGVAVDWKQVLRGGKLVELPTYPFQRQRYWIEPPGHPGGALGHRPPPPGHPLLGAGLTLATQTPVRVYETNLGLRRLPWLADHRVQGSVVLPGAAYAEMALAAAADALGPGRHRLTDLLLLEPMIVAADASVQIVITREQPGRLAFQVATPASGADRASFRVHARGVLHQAGAAAGTSRLELATVRARLRETDVAALYAGLCEVGLQYGPAFQGIEQLWLGDDEALGRLQLPPAAGSAVAYELHPALLDGCFQVLVAAVADRTPASPWVIDAVEELQLLQRPAAELFCHVRIVPADAATGERRRAELRLVDRAGDAIADIRGLSVKRLTRSAVEREPDGWILVQDWELAGTPPPRITAGRWLLLGRGGGVGSALCAALRTSGQAVVHAAVAGLDAAALRAIVAESFAGQPATAVVHLASLDGSATPDASGAEPWSACASALGTVQALAGMRYRDAPRLWLVTRGAQAVGTGDVQVKQAPLLGLGRVIALEHAELRCSRLDLDPAVPPGEAAALAAELMADGEEDEVVWRDGQRQVARLVRRLPQRNHPARREPACGHPFRLTIDKPGVLAALARRGMARRPPGPGEVELAVEAAGLNFLDVLLALGALPTDPPQAAGAPLLLGLECAGRIVAVGEGVRGLSVGDPVIALAPGALASHVTTTATLALPRPATLHPAQAAAMPVACLTALYALARIAHLDRGERVLIHAATGAVGLAAVQWAQHMGTEVYATAGTPHKRAYLESLGVRHVSDSRSERFVADVLAQTGGEGVDVVLNSLSGELLRQSFQLLRDHGRFIELGKRDCYADNQLALRPFLRNLSFSLIDLRAMIHCHPIRVRALLEEVLARIAAGTFSPPPIQTFAIADAASAFRTMAQAQHLGKLVFTLAEEPEGREVSAPAPPAAALVRPDSSYLVTGGLGGLGLSVAAWLAEQGAGQLVLLSRSGAADAERKAAVEALWAKGTRVRVAAADVGNRAQLAALLDELRAADLPLRGVIHAAGILDDGLLTVQTPARFQAVLHAKAVGAWHLHELTRELPLDFFVLYASAAGLLGSPGQGSYAAANTFLDALAHHRRAHGLPALSIDWGPFSQVGLAAAHGQRGERLLARGMRSLTPAAGLQALGRLLECRDAQVGVVPLNLRQWGAFYQTAATAPRLSRLHRETDAEAAPPASLHVRTQLAAAAPGERAERIADLLRVEAAQVLRIPPSKLGAEVPFAALGLDSLHGLELRNRIESVLGLRTPATLLWTYSTLSALSRYLAEQVAGADSAPAIESAPPAKSAPAADATSLLRAGDVLSLLDDALARAARKVP